MKSIDGVSPAQCVGYVAFVLGMSAFLQWDDLNLRTTWPMVREARAAGSAQALDAA